MVKVMCFTGETVRLGEVEPFQGNLKRRTRRDLEELRGSIVREGLLMPFAVWRHGGRTFLLDGHGRREVLLAMAEEDKEILGAEFPCVSVEAEDEAAARKALLQITSRYGRVTAEGARAFVASVPGYVAPSVRRFVASVPGGARPAPPRPPAGKVVIRVRVEAGMRGAFLEALSGLSFIEVLP